MLQERRRPSDRSRWKHREAESDRKDDTMLAVKMKEGVMSQTIFAMQF
jgi:hypothetical protein